MGPEARKHIRNVLIILLLAAAVAFVPGGGNGAEIAAWVLSSAFLAAIALVAGRLYSEHRVALFSIGDRWRAVLYGAIGVLVLTLTATSTLWSTGIGSVAWILLLAAVVFALFSVFRASRQY